MALWHWRCVLERSALYCTSLSCLRQSWSSRPRAVLDSSCGARGVSRPSFLLLDSTSLWPRRSSVASPVESESSASSNSRTAMQGREDRETRNKRTSRMQYLVSGQERRDVRARARRTEICAESGIPWINQCSVVMKGGTGGSSTSNVCTYAPARRLVYRRQLLFPHKGWG